MGYEKGSRRKRSRYIHSTASSRTRQAIPMPIEDIFSIEGRGTVVTGKIERGVVKVGETVDLIGFKPTSKTVVTGVEMFNKSLQEGQAGDNAGLCLRGLKKEISRGQVLAKPGSVTPHTEFESEVYILKKEEVVVILHSLRVISHSSISEQLTLLEK